MCACVCVFGALRRRNNRKWNENIRPTKSKGEKSETKEGGATEIGLFLRVLNFPIFIWTRNEKKRKLN